MNERKRFIGVIGPGDCTPAERSQAFEVGRLLAVRGWGVVCGGLGGVMEAACEGCLQGGGTTLGVLPGNDADRANPWVSVVVPSGMGEARNALVVLASDGVIAVGRGWGTLTEIGYARKFDKPVAALGSWRLQDDGVIECDSPEVAVGAVLSRVRP